MNYFYITLFNETTVHQDIQLWEKISTLSLLFRWNHIYKIHHTPGYVKCEFIINRFCPSQQKLFKKSNYSETKPPSSLFASFVGTHPLQRWSEMFS